MNEFFMSVSEGFRRYFSFSGTATRRRFWHWQLFIVAVGFLAVAFFSTNALWVWGALTIIPSITVSVRRLRDAGIPVWLTLFILLPFGQLAIFAMALAPTRKTP